MEPKVSIIIPVYNVEKYIERCLESISKQKYKDFEVIIINDGSTDKTLDIINKYKKKDKRINIYSQDNLGPSISRNNGIKKAKGEYLAFIDADDFITDTYLELMVSKCESEELDLVTCGYIDVSKYGKLKLNDFFNKYAINSKENFIRCILSGVGGTLWGKLFKRKLIIDNNLFIDEDLFMCEDLIFVLKYIFISKRYNSIGECLYIYNRLNENSISSKLDFTYYKNLLMVIERIETILRYEKINEGFIDDIISERIINLSINFIYLQSNSKVSKKDIIENIKIILSNSYLKKYKYKFVSNNFRNKVYIILINNNKVKLLEYYSVILNHIQKIKDRIKKI